MAPQRCFPFPGLDADRLKLLFAHINSEHLIYLSLSFDKTKGRLSVLRFFPPRIENNGKPSQRGAVLRL